MRAPQPCANLSIQEVTTHTYPAVPATERRAHSRASHHRQALGNAAHDTPRASNRNLLHTGINR